MQASWLALVLLAAPAILAGCVTPEVEPVATDDTTPPPAPDVFGRELPEVISKLTHFATSDVPHGEGIWIHGNYAYVSGGRTGLHIVDVSDPANPVLVSSMAGDFYSRDVDVLEYPDGRIVAVAASGGGGMPFIDVTDPTNPVLLSVVEPTASGTHNLAVVPGTFLVYNSGSGGKGDDIDVVDATDPLNPKQVASWGTHGCHDVTFYVTEDIKRAYCAAIEETQIWDITDPLDGKLVSAFTNPAISVGGAVLGDNGGLTPGLHHLAMVNDDATILIVGDEYTGGLGPGCVANTPDVSGPFGALWFYDIKDEANPKLISWIAPSMPAEGYAGSGPDAFGLSCTAHFGTPIPGKDMIAMSWYRAGVVLIDYKDVTSPQIVDQWNVGTNTWDVRYVNGYLFTGDMMRGLDVLTLE